MTHDTSEIQQLRRRNVKLEMTLTHTETTGKPYWLLPPQRPEGTFPMVPGLSASEAGRPCRILVVEDQAPIAIEMDARLREMGLECIGIASDSKRALAIARATRPDLALLDVRIQRGDGIELGQLLSDELGTGIVFVTAFADNETIDRADAVAPLGFLVKPFSSSAFRATLQMAIRQRSVQLSRLAAETALLSSRQSLIEAQRIGQLGSWTWDIAPNTLAWSDEVYHIFGVAPESFEATYDAFLTFVHPADRDRVRAAVSVSLSDGTAYETRHRVIRPDGSERTVIERGEVSFDMEGRVERMVGTVQDITRLGELEKALSRKQYMEAVGMFAGGIAHDFNNILMAVLNNAELLALDLEGTPSYGTAERIVAAAQRAAALVQQILTFSRTGTGERRETDLVVAVRSAVEMSRESDRARPNILFESAEQSLWVVANGAELEQVVMNLCSNAVRAVGDEGSIVVTLEADDAVSPPCATLRVTDDGCGMPPGVLDHAFEPFFTTRSANLGTGLGLAVVRTIVENLGGSIQLSSEPLRGTTAEVSLPLVNEPAESRLSDPHLRPGAGETILVVDDDPEVRNSIGTLLRRLGYCVEEVEGANAALAYVRVSRPALVLTDLTMPGLNGVDLAAQLEREFPQVPVVLLTGHGDSIDRDLPPTIRRVAGKPIGCRELSAIIRETIE